jgi:excisionase family DNA binding protein
MRVEWYSIENRELQVYIEVSAASMAPDTGVAVGVSPAAPLLLTVSQAADCLQVSRSSLYREVGRGRLQVVKLGHLTRVRLEDLQAYVSGLAAPTR